MGVRERSSCDGDRMAQMDPASTKTASPMTDFSDYRHSPSPIQSASSRVSDTAHSTPLGSACTSSADRLVTALKIAADKTATSIAYGTKQTRLEVRERLNEVIAWVVSTLQTGEDKLDVSPVIAREYVSTLKVNFLSELDGASGLDAHEVVRTLIKLDAAEEAWKRTDRGKFIARLTGADCADAVVAIAHDIRSPLGSILLLVDALRRAERSTSNPFRERQLGLIYGAAFGLSTTVSNLIAAARGDGLVQAHPLPFSITETMHAVGSIVQPMCEEKGIPLGI